MRQPIPLSGLPHWFEIKPPWFPHSATAALLRFRPQMSRRGPKNCLSVSIRQLLGCAHAESGLKYYHPNFSPFLRSLSDSTSLWTRASIACLRCCAFRSISTDRNSPPTLPQGCRRWLVEDLKSVGFDASVRILRPAIRWSLPIMKVRKAARMCVLFYGHYDVQPVDPLELWLDDLRAGAEGGRAGYKVITGRSSADDKGSRLT